MEINSDLLHRGLKYYYGYEVFRPSQEEIVREILEGKPILAVLPTGGGKSLCFQLPSMFLKGITLVISPLISLMKDQTENLQQRGVGAAYLESHLPPAEYGRVIHKVLKGQCKFLYVSPERLDNKEFLALAPALNITLVAVDEAHCISQWGPGFRKEYYNIPAFLRQLPHRPLIAAFTATATPAVRRDILEHLDISGAKQVVMSFDRPNLHFAVEFSGNKERSLLAYVNKHRKECGVIYCATRGAVEKLAAFLQEQGFSALRYHAGLTPEERKRNQQSFVSGKVPIIVATNAFGMGIDKSDVRYVVHFNMPKDLEGYYQEAGRAGRDGLPGECLLLFNPEDITINEELIRRGDNGWEYQQQERRLLEQMKGYCRTPGCLRNYVLNYFGEKTEGNCGNCSNCDKKGRKSWFMW